jgi:hypothetical protein
MLWIGETRNSDNLGEGTPLENSQLEDRSGDIDIKLPEFMFVYTQKYVYRISPLVCQTP